MRAASTPWSRGRVERWATKRALAGGGGGLHEVHRAGSLSTARGRDQENAPPTARDVLMDRGDGRLLVGTEMGHSRGERRGGGKGDTRQTGGPAGMPESPLALSNLAHRWCHRRGSRSGHLDACGGTACAARSGFVMQRRASAQP